MLLTAGSLSCQRADGPNDPAPQAATSELVSTDDYLVFDSPAEFAETQNTIDDLAPNEGVHEHLKAWEDAHDWFYSMRRHYYDLEAQGDTTSVSPIADPYVATVFSPEGVVQIGANIYKIDFTTSRISYIPTEYKSTLYSALLAGENNSAIRYFYTDENVFDALANNDLGTSVGVVRDETLLRCPRGASGKQDGGNEFYSNNQRLKCLIVYQPLGIYFSITGSAKNQKRFLGLYLGQKACMYTVPNPGASWEERCPSLIYGSYTTYDSNFCGVLVQNDNNEVVARPYSSIRGLRHFVYDTKFNINSSFTTRNFHIED